MMLFAFQFHHNNLLKEKLKNIIIINVIKEVLVYSHFITILYTILMKIDNNYYMCKLYLQFNDTPLNFIFYFNTNVY